MKTFPRNPLLLCALACTAALLVAVPAPVPAQQVGGNVVLDTSAAEDQYLAGGSVTLRADAAGDVIAAGGRILLDGRIDGDVNAAGGMIDLFGRVADDARLAGGRLTVGAEVGGDLIVAGGSVALQRDTTVTGRAWLTGGKLEINGHIGGDLKATGGRVELNASVDGNTTVTAERVRIGPKAQITGKFTYRSPREAVIEQGAKITGTVEHLPYRGPMGFSGSDPAAASAVGGVWTLGLIVTGAVLVLMFPAGTAQLTANLRDTPGRAAWVGFALLAAVPVAALLCVVLIIAIPLGLALGALYPIALIAGYLTGALWLAEGGLGRFAAAHAERTGWRAGSLAIVLVALAAVGWVPILGWLVFFAILVLGLGALALQVNRMAQS